MKFGKECFDNYAPQTEMLKNVDALLFFVSRVELDTNSYNLLHPSDRFQSMSII